MTAAILELCFLFRFWPICSHRQVILHQPVKFRHNRDYQRRSYDVISIFQDGGHRVGNLLPVSVLAMVLAREDGNTKLPNFDVISQSTSEIKLLPVSENGRPPYWNFTSDFDLDLCLVLCMRFCFSLPNFVAIRRRRRSYDVMSIFQDGGHRFRKLLPCSVPVIAFVQNGEKSICVLLSR